MSHFQRISSFTKKTYSTFANPKPWALKGTPNSSGSSWCQCHGIKGGFHGCAWMQWGGWKRGLCGEEGCRGHLLLKASVESCCCFFLNLWKLKLWRVNGRTYTHQQKWHFEFEWWTLRFCILMYFVCVSSFFAIRKMPKSKYACVSKWWNLKTWTGTPNWKSKRNALFSIHMFNRCLWWSKESYFKKTNDLCILRIINLTSFSGASLHLGFETMARFGFTSIRQSFSTFWTTSGEW